MKAVITMGSICYIDKLGDERFIPISVDKDTGLKYFDTDETNFAELELVGDEVTLHDELTISELWDKIRILVHN